MQAVHAVREAATCENVNTAQTPTHEESGYEVGATRYYEGDSRHSHDRHPYLTGFEKTGKEVLRSLALAQAIRA